MRDPLRSIAIWLIFCSAVRSANNSTNSTTDNNSQESLCGETFDQANATGYFSFSPGILLPSQEQPPNFTWAVTLLGGVPQNTSLDYSFWYDTGGLNYSDSLSLGYDVCAIYLEPLGVLNNTDMRAQHDNGSCLTAFDADCVAALKQQSEDYAFQLTGFPTALPNSNLTADSLPTVCNDLASMMTSALPKQCKPYMNEGMDSKLHGRGGMIADSLTVRASLVRSTSEALSHMTLILSLVTDQRSAWFTAHSNRAVTTNVLSQTEYLVYGLALTTDYARTGLSFGNTDICTIGSSLSNQSFNYIDGYDTFEDAATPRKEYDRSSWTLLATLAVFMPVANARRTISMDYAVSVVSCLGVKHFNQDSRMPAAAPQPTPVNLGGGGLSGGDIAGIVVSSVAGVGIVVAAAAFFWLRKRKAIRRKSEADPPDIVYPDDKPVYSAVDPLAPAEFGDERALQEIDSREAYKSELPDAASKDPVELAGSTPTPCVRKEVK